MKIVDEKRSSLDSLIYVFFFLGTLGIVFSLKGMYSDQPMLWLSKPLAWGIIIGFALTLAGLILRLANPLDCDRLQLCNSIRNAGSFDRNLPDERNAQFWRFPQ